jgi:copper chaperone CopZ
MEKLSYTVPGMHCENCEAAVREAVSSLTGVVEVSVDLATKQVDVTGSRLDDAGIRAAIEDAGYEPA